VSITGRYPYLVLTLASSPQSYVPQTSITFVSQASIDSGVVASYGLKKRIEPVRNCRNIGKADMKHNAAMPKMKVDPERYVCFCAPYSRPVGGYSCLLIAF
jgi:urease alpha subunit